MLCGSRAAPWIKSEAICPIRPAAPRKIAVPSTDQGYRATKHFSRTAASHSRRILIVTLMSKLKKIPERGPQVLAYLYHQKLRFGITNTKFDISFTVFRESFLNDQYRIKSFARHLDGTDSLLFLDVGRNHGFVFYYLLDHLAKTNIRIGRIQYIGIDPSPIKFAYYDRPPAGTQVDYRLIDRAVVFDGSQTVRLKYGERNLGNFNVTGSNYETSMKEVARRREFIEIEVETLQAEALMDLVAEARDYSAAIVKIDCKNQTEILMEQALERLEGQSGPWLAACEPDGSSEGRLRARAQAFPGALVMSNREF